MNDQRLKQLHLGVSELKITLPEQAESTLLAYLDLLQKWNKAYNLTAITDPTQMVSHHLLDSLAVVPYINGNHILDVGTGAGLPGLVLAIALPDKQVVLLDSNGKKVRFLLQAIATLKLTNVKAVQARIESYQSEQLFDVIISRALGEAQHLVDNGQRLLCNNGRFLLMKGKYPSEELQAITLPYKVEPLQVPGIDAPRHVVIIKNEDRT